MIFGSAISWVANSIPVAAIANLANTVQGYALNLFAAPTASLNLNSQKIVSLAAGTANTDAVNKGQMDTADTATLNAAKALPLAALRVVSQGSRRGPGPGDARAHDRRAPEVTPRECPGGPVCPVGRRPGRSHTPGTHGGLCRVARDRARMAPA